MTTQHTDEMRDAFEKWYVDDFNGGLGADKENELWLCWQASASRYQDALHDAREALIGANSELLEHGVTDYELKATIIKIDKLLGEPPCNS